MHDFVRRLNGLPRMAVRFSTFALLSSSMAMAACSSGNSTDVVSGDVVDDSTLPTDTAVDTSSDSAADAAGDLFDTGHSDALYDSTDVGAMPFPGAIDLAQWKIASSVDVGSDGAALSAPEFDDSTWIPAVVPGTVAGAQYEAGLLGTGANDPLFGENLKSVPGWMYSFLPMPDDSPYKPSWWYRTEIDLPESPESSARTWVVFEGINYSANVWVNGVQIASRSEVVGTFREFRFDVTDVIRPGRKNAIAVEVFVPDIFNDLAIYWVDWNPEPPDYNMGLWMPARLERRGPLSILNPAVLTNLNADGSAELTVVADIHNASDQPIEAVLSGIFNPGEFSGTFTVNPGETKTVRMTSADTPILHVQNPLLWWPYNYGEQYLYEIQMELAEDGTVSDRFLFKFGIREVTAEIIPPNSIKYSINGKPILIRGGGWAPDIFLRDDESRDEWEIRYVKDMGLNTIRLEGKLENHRFYDLCDREGILLMPGWCCCDTWEGWENWGDNHGDIAKASLENQLRRLRRHASVFTWLNGSDFHPVPDVENMYLTVADKADWNLPIVSNATETPSTVTGPSGMKMTGPYHWVPPQFWYVAVPDDPMILKDRIDWEWLYGGAFGFNSESSPGPAVPPMDSLLKMLKPEDIWPVREPFLFHSGGTSTATERMTVFNNALSARLGEPANAADYAWKSQIMAYESHRAMFEAQGRNKYFATGFIQWMLNNAWPGTIWHLYDYFMRPGGSYFGAKSAMKPIHVQYSYDDSTVWVVNSTLKEYDRVKVTATIYDINSAIVASTWKQLEKVRPDANVEALDITPEIEGAATELAPVYFIDLRLQDSGGIDIDRNFYWLATKADSFDMVYRDYELPEVDYADMTALANLPPASVEITPAISIPNGKTNAITAEIGNKSATIAFFIEVLAVDADTGETILPVVYTDNYFSLLPYESRQVSATVPAESVKDRNVTFRVTGTNIPPTQ